MTGGTAVRGARGERGLTCALAGGAGEPRFSHFLVGAVTFTTVVVGDAHPTWTLWTCGQKRTRTQGPGRRRPGPSGPSVMVHR